MTFLRMTPQQAASTPRVPMTCEEQLEAYRILLDRYGEMILRLYDIVDELVGRQPGTPKVDQLLPERPITYPEQRAT